MKVYVTVTAAATENDRFPKNNILGAFATREAAEEAGRKWLRGVDKVVGWRGDTQLGETHLTSYDGTEYWFAAMEYLVS